MKYLKNINYMIAKIREPLFALFLGGISAGFLLIYKLGSLTPGLSATEITTRYQSSSINLIATNPINLPYKLFEWILQYFGKYNIVSTRLVSVIFSAISIWLFFYILNKWYTYRIAIFGTIIYASTAWFLHISRFSSPLVLYLSIVGIIAYGTWIKYTNRHELALIVGVSLLMYLVYIPGMIWFIIIGLIWQRKTISQLIKNASNVSLVASFLFVILLAPMAWGVYKNPAILHSVFGIPATFPAFSQLLNNIVNIPKYLFMTGPSSPELWLNNIPLLNIFLIAMLIIGCYSFFVRSRLDRSKMILGTLILSGILIGLNGTEYINLLIPPIFLLITGGIALMLQRWFKVFPRNPIARSIGISLIIVLILASVGYEAKHYFVAWPNSPTTKKTFNIRL